MSCQCNNGPEKVILSPLPETVLQPIQVLSAPESVRGVAATVSASGSSGFTSPQEQPPRL
jgi:hypothetical protein